MRFTIAAKLILATSLISIVIIGTFTWYQHKSDYNELEDKFGLTLKHIAITAAASIKGEEHDKIHRPEDIKSKEFIKIRKYLKKIQKRNYLDPDHIYTFRIKSEKELVFSVMLHEKPFLGHIYKVPPVNQPLVKIAISGRPIQTKVYQDPHGTWISAYAPIITKSGKVTGILEVDYDIKKFIVALNKKLITGLVRSAFILAGGMILILMVSFGITKPIKILSRAVEKIKDSDFNVVIPINSNDEIGDLARSFQSMTTSLSERLHMLKYISPHTQEMIAKQINHEIPEKGESKNVVILFSDMRGFTQFSESRPPEEIIELLNRLLSVQSDIIQRYEGKIDKYVGDEVIAIFEGQSKVMNAIYTALEIHKEILNLNEKNQEEFRFEVGIGLSLGDVIIGNIGSDFRKDYTVIGSNVNLAARLCGSAKPGDVLITSDMYRATQQDDSLKHVLEFDAQGEVNLKGLSLPVHVYNVRYKLQKSANV